MNLIILARGGLIHVVVHYRVCTGVHLCLGCACKIVGPMAWMKRGVGELEWRMGTFNATFAG